MTQKEKLTELIEKARYAFTDSEAIASFLVSHGVVVRDMSEWISVKDRLPEQLVSVLIYIPDEAPFPTVHEAYNINNRTFHAINALYDLKYVTHWMPMPETPEEEE